jgi:hypothetical protein
MYVIGKIKLVKEKRGGREEKRKEKSLIAKKKRSDDLLVNLQVYINTSILFILCWINEKL